MSVKKSLFHFFRVAVACGLSLVFLLSGFRHVQGAQTDTEEIVISAAEILYNNEGSYDSVNANDNGAVSIGKLQWHGWRALSLLQTVAKANDERAKELLGTKLYNEVTTTTDTSKWGSRVLTSAEASAVKKFLAIQESKQAQDVLAHKDITSYVEQGISCRKALAFGKKLLSDYVAAYEGELRYPKIQETVWELLYRPAAPVIAPLPSEPGEEAVLVIENTMPGKEQEKPYIPYHWPCLFRCWFI